MLTFQKIRPLGDKILLKRSKAKTSVGGILLPESAQKETKEGIIIAVGEGKINKKGEVIALSVKQGDRVLFQSYAGMEFSSDGDDYVILSEDEILGILT